MLKVTGPYIDLESPLVGKESRVREIKERNRVRVRERRRRKKEIRGRK